MAEPIYGRLKKGTRTVSGGLHCLAFPVCILDRPGARKVDCSPNLSAVCSCQAALPNGWLLATERRNPPLPPLAKGGVGGVGFRLMDTFDPSAWRRRRPARWQHLKQLVQPGKPTTKRVYTRPRRRSIKKQFPRGPGHPGEIIENHAVKKWGQAPAWFRYCQGFSRDGRSQSPFFRKGSAAARNKGAARPRRTSRAWAFGPYLPGPTAPLRRGGGLARVVSKGCNHGNLNISTRSIDLTGGRVSRWKNAHRDVQVQVI